MSNTWELCPKCKGNGDMRGQSQHYKICDLCNGKKIISSLTGLPPEGKQDQIRFKIRGAKLVGIFDRDGSDD